MRFENYCDHMLRNWLICKPDLSLKLNYSIDCKAFGISLCWQFTYLHNLAWTFLRHIYRTILGYENLKICNLYDAPCAITLVYIQESMSKVHDLIVKPCEIVNWISKNCFHSNTPVLPNQPASTFFLRLILSWLTKFVTWKVLNMYTNVKS